MSDISKSDTSSAAGANLYGQVAGQWSILASNLSTDSAGKLETSSSNLEKLASAGVVTRSSQGGFQLQVRLQEDKSVSADPVTAAGSPVKSLIEDSVAQETGHSGLDSTVVNALSQSPASPQGTISSPFMNSDSAAKLIFAMSEIFETESRVRKFTDQLYANLINQKFEQSYSQMSAVNQQFDAEKTRLLGAIAGADMALIGALVSAGVGIAVTSASLMSSKRSEIDPEIQADSTLRDKALKGGIADRGKENPSQTASSLTLHPQEKETYLEAAARGENAQTGSETARVPKSVSSERSEEVEASSSASPPDGPDAIIRQESTAMRAGDALLEPLQEQKSSIAASLRALDGQLETLEAKQKDLQLRAQNSAQKGQEAQSALEQTRGENRANDDKIAAAHSQSQELFAAREAHQQRKEQLESEGQRLQRELEALSSDLDPSKLESQSRQLQQSKVALSDQQISTSQSVKTSSERVEQLQLERDQLKNESAELKKIGDQLLGQRAGARDRADEAQSALDNIGAKTLALLEANPKWQTSLGKSGGMSPNATFLNTNSVQFSSLKGGGIASQKFAGELSRAHGRSGADGSREYNAWHTGVEKYLKSHGGAGASDQKEAIASFNDAWKKGVDLNKVAERLSAGGTLRSPAQLRQDRAAAMGDLALADQALSNHQPKSAALNEKLAVAEQSLSAARFDKEARADRLAEIEGNLRATTDQLSGVDSQRQQLRELASSRDKIGDQIAQNRAQVARADGDLQSADQAFVAKDRELSALQQSGQQLRVRADHLGTQVQSARLEQGQIEDELASLQSEMTSLRARRGELRQDQSDLEGQIAALMTNLSPSTAGRVDSADPITAAEAGIAPPSASGESPPASGAPATRLELADDSASQVASSLPANGVETSSTAAPHSAQAPDAMSVDLKPASPPSEGDRAAAQGDRAAAQSRDASQFKRHLGDFFQFLSNPSVLELFRDIGTRTGDIITQMGQIYKAQAGIAANDILQNSQTEQAYLETSEALLQQLITQTADDSKQIDKEMQNLLDVIKSISQSKTDMARSLYLG